MRGLVFTWRRLARLITVADFVAFIGFWLYRGTLRRTTSVAVALLAVVLLGKGEADGLRLGSAATATGVIFILSCLGGLTLVALAGSFSKSALTLGDAKGFNLLEDMKKHRQSLHRDTIWRTVLRYEQFRYDPRRRVSELETVHVLREPLLDMCDPHRRRELTPARRLELERVIRDLGTTEQGWRVAFAFAMQVPMGRAELIYRLRYDVSQLKDWYDGSPFHPSDNKLREQHDGNEELAEARSDAGYGLRDRWSHAQRRFAQGLWFRSITRAVQLRTAQACVKLDRRYAPHRFSIDHFLWPSMLVDRRVAEELGEGALGELRCVRRRLFHRVFHSDVGLAHQLMHKAIYPNFYAATVLRRRYDPEYLLGELEESWSEDIHRHNRAFRQTPRTRQRRVRIRREARHRDGKLRAFLAAHPDLTPTSAESLRALRIAYHVDYPNLRARLDRGNPAAAIRQVERRTVDFTRKLLAVRQHHALCRMELEDYEFYIERILA